MFDAVIGTTSGVWHRDQSGNLTSLGLDGERIWAIHAWREDDATTILAGSYGNGIYRSTDGGTTWAQANEGLTATALRTIQPDPAGDGSILCGCEPGRAFRSTDGGQSWSEMAAIKDLPSVEEWYLPYSPRAGALRNFYSPPGQPQRLLASVEVGGLLGSTDGGETWELLEIQPDDDVHYVTGHPDRADLLFTALGWASLDRNRSHNDEPKIGGVARSADGGATWTKLFSDYTRAVIVPPTHTDLLLAAPAGRVGALGRISVSSDMGDSWQDASGGLESPMEDMVEIFHAAPDGTIWAICSRGRLLQATPGEWQWEQVIAADAGIEAESVAFLPS